MKYILMAFQIFPLSLLITAIIYIIICKIKNINIKGRNRTKALSEFALIGFFVMFIYVTQIMDFNGGLGSGLNLKPLHPFYISAKYGTVNGGMISQIWLNVLMCIPLGILLPIVFPKRFDRYLPVFIVSFGLTFVTELIQLLTGRSADIDDIIANTIGGLLGFAIYIFYYGMRYLFNKKKGDDTFKISNYKLKVVISIAILLITFSPFVVINIIESQSEFGHVYYGHLMPEKIVLNKNISTSDTKSVVYKIYFTESQEEVGKRIIKNSGFKNYKFDKIEDNTMVYSEDDSKSIYVYKDNTWNITYGVANKVNKRKLPNEENATKLAKTYLDKFEIDTNKLKYVKLGTDYGDDNLHLIFEPIEEKNSKIKSVGEVVVEIGEDGKLFGISDRRVQGKYYKEVDIIKPEKAVEVAKDVGVGDTMGTAYINDIRPSYYVQEETGYLIPTWNIKGNITYPSGQTSEWNPNIESIK
ncbi:VanZ family protein [Faecalimicrobium sp. JNUCC 81]